MGAAGGVCSCCARQTGLQPGRVEQGWNASCPGLLNQTLACSAPAEPTLAPLPSSPCLQRYVKIAAMLPRKSVRDVALRCRWTLNQQLLKKRKPGEPLVPPAGGLGGAKKPLGAAGGLLPPKAPALPPVPMVSGGRQQREGAALGAAGQVAAGPAVGPTSGWWQRQRLCCSLLWYSTRESALCCECPRCTPAAERSPARQLAGSPCCSPRRCQAWHQQEQRQQQRQCRRRAPPKR